MKTNGYNIIKSKRRSRTPSVSPLHALNKSCIVASRFSGTPATCCRLLIGSIDDCLPKLNLRLLHLRRCSREDCRDNCRLRDRSDPVDNCHDIPLFSSLAIPSISIFLINFDVRFVSSIF